MKVFNARNFVKNVFKDEKDKYFNSLCNNKSDSLLFYMYYMGRAVKLLLYV